MRILFADGTKGFSPTRLKEKATGGILGSLTIIPRHLAAKGHEVFVKSEFAEQVVVDGVTYCGKSEALPKWDVIVLNRNYMDASIVAYSKKIGAKVVWWLHDIVDFRYLEDNSFKFVDKIVALSDYCKRSYSQFYDLPESLFTIIPNGVDRSVFYPGPYEQRIKHRVIMASALIKGYVPVETTWTNLKRHFPSADLVIYSNQNLHDFENSSLQDAFLRRMTELKAQVFQPVAQPVLAEIMRSAWALLMPNNYPEICSNLLLQARACGLPIITSNIGSASEFIDNGKTGIISDCYPHDMHLWVKKYAEATIRLCMDDALHRRISEAASKGIADWNTIGEKWNELLTSITQQN